MEIFFFGGTGFLGHHIARDLSAHGHDVTLCASGKSRIFARAIAALPFIAGDKQGKVVTLKRYFELMIDEIRFRFHGQHICFTIEKAHHELGHKPHCTTEETVQKNVRWAADILHLI